ncbi:MAG: hypothetical protein B7Z75_05515 [Acidocella sp. 20-57-95]|nr:MAG: hypothetical protein B7Z75_05515 [Acidocella sp. 20-57-95]HQT64597.1 hypothetical protein [Acidocella sp.]HQU04396.1 hypothetical protein [Acidocella sp.]
MILPFTLPDWLPAWAFLLAALPVLLYVLVFLIMPFSVFGVKARLEAIETQLDSLHDEIRYLANKTASPTTKILAADDEPDTFPHFGRLKSAHQNNPAPKPRRAEPRLD